MSLKTLVSILTLTAGGSLSIAIAACAAPTDEVTDPQGEVAGPSDDELRVAKLRKCEVDSDCAATPVSGCCPKGEGEMTAVSKEMVATFAKDNSCEARPQACSRFIVRDSRVAQCNTATNKCEMIEPDHVRCGGFTRNPHRCAKGFSCDHQGVHPDAPGTMCVSQDDLEDAPKPKRKGDCRSHGCSSGRVCSPCFNKFACIPEGAKC